MSFKSKLENTSRDSLLCIGLDPDPAHLPDHLKGRPSGVSKFLIEIVAATRDLTCAYKPNFAFYGSQGQEGWKILEGTIKAIGEDMPILLDFKAGDIGNTAAHYAKMAYEVLGADAVTVNPLMGEDAVDPFLAYPDGCAFILCVGSNPGSADFQRLETSDGPLYRKIAEKAVSWSQKAACGLVVGATYAEELAGVREVATDLPILVPGVGAQGGDAEEVLRAGLDANGGGMLVNASRSVLYASSGEDYAEAARKAAAEMRETLEKARLASSC